METSTWRKVVDYLVEYGWMIGLVLALLALIVTIRWTARSKPRTSDRMGHDQEPLASEAGDHPLADRIQGHDVTQEGVSFSQLKGFVEAASAQLGQGHLSGRDGHRIEWHGRCLGVPLLMSCERMGDGWLVQMQSEVANPHGLLGLHWDPTKGPEATISGTPHPEEKVRVYLAPNLFLEGLYEDIEEELACLDRLPNSLISEVFARMPADELSYWHFHETQVALGFSERFLRDAKLLNRHETVQRLVNVALLLARFTQDLATAPTPAASAGTEPSLGLLAACRSCRRRCVTRTDGTCPHCGSRVA